MRFMILALVVISLVFQTALVYARTYDVEAVGEYVMGDSDTKLEARRIALEQAKRNRPTNPYWNLFPDRVGCGSR